MKIVGNLKELIAAAAEQYISLHASMFKSTTPGPQGIQGEVGPQGQGVHHMKGTSTTDPEGDFSTLGEKDTYTFYADANETIPLAWFTIANGSDPYKRAVDKGYEGTEEEFYGVMAEIRTLLNGTVASFNGRAGVIVLTKNDVEIALGRDVDISFSSKADLVSPTFTGTPLAPTASVGSASTQIATTAFVSNELNKIEEW